MFRATASYHERDVAINGSPTRDEYVARPYMLTTAYKDRSTSIRLTVIPLKA
jgi:hypothetical protein